jgi:hypothetical protein
MYSYNHDHLKTIFASIIRENTASDAYLWLNEKIASLQTVNQFSTTFVAIPRRTGKSVVKLTKDESREIAGIRPNLILKDWTIDRLARVWLLLHADASDREKYFRNIESLFLTAEVNELVALYSALPLLAYQEKWTARCSEGIRNNIGDVLKVIMCNNPYPSENLNEAAWNQMVLKAFFTEKPVEEIIGLDERANERLAKTLSDYAHERWAAHRNVNPLLWRCVGPFINEQIFPDIQKLFDSENKIERDAAVLAIHYSNYSPAKKMVTENDRYEIESGKLSWELIAEKYNDHVLQQ